MEITVDPLTEQTHIADSGAVFAFCQPEYKSAAESKYQSHDYDDFGMQRPFGKNLMFGYVDQHDKAHAADAYQKGEREKYQIVVVVFSETPVIDTMSKPALQNAEMLWKMPNQSDLPKGIP